MHVARTALVAAVALAASACTHRPVYEEVVTTDVVAAVEFKLERCERAEGAVACRIAVTNRGNDARLVFTDRDVSAWGGEVQLGLKDMKFAGAPTVAVNTTVRSGVGQRLDLTLTGADADLRALRLIEIKVAVLDRGNTGGNAAARPVQLRNLRLP